MGCATAICIMGLLSGPADPPDATTEAIRTAYAANRAALSYGTVRFEVLSGHAKDLESARRGDFARKWTATGLYVFDGPRARYEVVYPIADLVSARTKTGPKAWSTPLVSERFLTDGRLSLIDKIGVDPDDRNYFHTTQSVLRIFGGSDFLPPLPVGEGVGTADG